MSRNSGCVYQDSGVDSKTWLKHASMRLSSNGAYRLVMKGKTNIQKLTMDFYSRIGMNHLSNITNELVFSSIKDTI